MIDPITIAIAAKVITLIIALALLTFAAIIEWFDDYQKYALTTSAMEEVGFTILQALGTRDYNTVQGVFNTRTNRVTDGRVIKSQRIDEQLASYHGSRELVLYT